MSGTRRHTGPGAEEPKPAAAREKTGSSPPPGRSSDAESDEQGPASPDDLGSSILNVLRAAQEEAGRLVSAAEADAQAIRENAETERSELRGQLESEMEDRRQQLTVLRNEAEGYAEERRREADLEASRIRAEAEAEVSARREELDAATGKLEELGLRRQELVHASRALEDWLSATVGTLREVVAKLEKVLEAPPAALDETLLQEAQSVVDEASPSGVDIREALTTRAGTEQPTADRPEPLVKPADADDWVPLDSE